MLRSEDMAMIRLLWPTTVSSMAPLVRRITSRRAPSSRSLAFAQRFRNLARRLEVLAHAALESRAGELERIAQPGFDIDVEPGVDSTADELDREIVDQRERQHGEADEDRHHARGQPRTRDLAAVLAHQPDEVRGNQPEQDGGARQVEQEDPVVDLAEAIGVLDGRGEEQHRHHQQRQP
jgi:hypothetical protein